MERMSVEGSDFSRMLAAEQGTANVVDPWYFYLPILVVFGGNFLFFFWCQYKQDNSFIDVFWGITFVTPILSLMAKRYNDGNPPDARCFLVLALNTCWALRLSYHIMMRHKGEDFRY
jgi:steroid 5-alpha reductase family enzyme